VSTAYGEALRPLVLSLLEQANSFPVDVYPGDFHGLMDHSDERGSDGTLLLQFYAALAILSRDMFFYFQAHPQRDAAVFENLVGEVHAEDRRLWGESAFPFYRGIAGADLSLGLAEVAAAGAPSLEPLGDPALIHEWSTRPGALVYKRTMSALKDRGVRERVCREGGYYQQYAKHRISAPELHTLIVTSIVEIFVGVPTFWLPLAVLVSVVLVRRGLKQYCGGSPASPAVGSNGGGAERSSS
jgi:hypothetical protein